jgi:hypothetical protein
MTGDQRRGGRLTLRQEDALLAVDDGRVPPHLRVSVRSLVGRGLVEPCIDTSGVRPVRVWRMTAEGRAEVGRIRDTRRPGARP